MSVLGGWMDMQLSAAKTLIGTPLQTGAKLLANPLATAGNAVGKLADGDLGGAARECVNGANRQVDTLCNYPRNQLQNMKDYCTGAGEVVTSLVGNPFPAGKGDLPKWIKNYDPNPTPGFSPTPQLDLPDGVNVKVPNVTIKGGDFQPGQINVRDDGFDFHMPHLTLPEIGFRPGQIDLLYS